MWVWLLSSDLLLLSRNKGGKSQQWHLLERVKLWEDVQRQNLICLLPFEKRRSLPQSLHRAACFLELPFLCELSELFPCFHLQSTWSSRQPTLAQKGKPSSGCELGISRLSRAERDVWGIKWAEKVCKSMQLSLIVGLKSSYCIS